MDPNDFGTRIARFDVRAFRLISRFVSTEETRYYLKGVHIEPVAEDLGGGVVLVATDGVKLGAYWDAAGFAARPVTVSVPLYAGLARMVDHWREGEIAMHYGLGPDARVFAAHHAGEASFMDAALGAENAGSDRFPPWRKVVPWNLMNAEGGTRAKFDWRQLEPFAAAFHDDEIDEHDGSTIPAQRLPQIFGADPDGPHLVLRHDIKDFFGAVMPICRPKLSVDKPTGQVRTKQVERLLKLAPAPEPVA